MEIRFVIHIKLDTGMRRLGFEESEINELVVRLRNNKTSDRICLSHLAASDEAEHDGFTQLQLDRFVKKWAKQFSRNLNIR